MGKLYLSSTRGIIGDWIYYPALMKFKDIAERVNLAHEICESNISLDIVHQDVIEKGGQEIKNYLTSHKQRFLNSLIVAVYGGSPSWYGITDLRANETLGVNANEIPDEVIESIGILSFSGDEKFFALNGQDQLIGIRHAVEENSELGEDELVVIFIAHQTDEEGIKRTQELFNTFKAWG
jgi:DNA sulfur modification protein DndB